MLEKPPLVHAQKKQSPNWRPPVALSTPLGCPRKWMDQWWTDQWVSYNLLIDGVFLGVKKTHWSDQLWSHPLGCPGTSGCQTPRWVKIPKRPRWTSQSLWTLHPLLEAACRWLWFWAEKLAFQSGMFLPAFGPYKDIVTLQGINISHLGKRKIIFKMPFWGDMLVPWRV